MPVAWLQGVQVGRDVIQCAVFVGPAKVKLESVPLLGIGRMPPGAKDQGQRWLPASADRLATGEQLPKRVPRRGLGTDTAVAGSLQKPLFKIGHDQESRVSGFFSDFF